MDETTTARTSRPDSGAHPAAFGARLRAAMTGRGPLAVGIDPHPALLDAWGLPPTPQGLERFSLTVIEALADRAAVLKPQSAFFEEHGSAGIAVLERVLAAGRAAGALMLLDAKRGDIGSTMSGYARAYLSDGSPLAADAVTLSPYLGFGALDPAVDVALGSGRGVFVLCRTSNPEGASVQLAVGRCTGMTASAAIAAAAAERNSGAAPLGSVGLVVGATVRERGVTADDLAAVNGPLLAPGIGAQGGAAADLKRIFGAARANVLPTVSRSVLAAGPDPVALRDAWGRALDEVRAALAPGR